MLTNIDCRALSAVCWQNALKILLVCALFGKVLSAEFPLEIVDNSGTKVLLPKSPERIVVGGGMWPLPSLVVMLDSSAKRLVYIPRASANALKSSFLLDFYPEIAQIPAGNSENIEELLGLKPDLFVCHSANTKLCESMRKTKIPTIALSVSKWEYDSSRTLQGWLEIFAPILNAEQKAAKILQWVSDTQEFVKSLPQPLSAPRVVILHRFDNERHFSVGGLFANYLLQHSGARNAISQKNIQNVTLEELYAINPEIIYLNHFNDKLPKDILESKLWQPLNAVQNKRVYKFPLGSYRAFAPSVDLPILLLWLQARHYPHRDFQLREKISAYYKEVFDLTLSNAQIEKILNPTAQAGALE